MIWPLVAFMISVKCGMVSQAANGGTMSQENIPPTIQKLSHDQPLTFLYGI